MWQLTVLGLKSLIMTNLFYFFIIILRNDDFFNQRNKQ